MAPRVHIIILNWNDYQSTLSCVESLRSITYPNYHIIVTDNGSSNESVRRLAAIADIELQCNDHNLGFADGNNQAMRNAMAGGADYVWLLNNDATIEPDCLTKLVQAAEKDNRVGLVSPVIYETGTQKIQHCGSRFDLSVPLLEEASDIATALRWQHESPYGVMLWGTALLIPRRTIEAIGVLDGHLFAYAEDSDYSIRSAKKGFKNLTVFDASVWHQGHTGHRKPHYYYYVVRNSFRFWKKHVALKTYLKIVWWNLDHTKNRIAKLKGYPDQINACLLGLWDGCRGIGGEYDRNRKAPWFVRAWLG